MTEIMRTPVKLDQLDQNHATFTGTAEETRTVNGIFGEAEVSAKYPVVFVQREVWEALGFPVAVTLILEERRELQD